MKCQERLFDILHDLQGLTIAVSGGVDSTLLAYIANLVLGQTVKWCMRFRQPSPLQPLNG